MKKIRWGILSTAKIAREKVIPALQASTKNEVVAIASRSDSSARAAADALGIEHAYGSYEALLADPSIDAIYNPLPNHLHVDWSINAMAAGKHVLCEKPLGLNATDAHRLVTAQARHTNVKAMEAFMYRFHPQWQLTKKLLADNKIGNVRSVHSHFSYNNREPGNIRNTVEMGGGGLLDVGCYSISLSRWILEQEPVAILGHNTPFEGEEVDCLFSGILEFDRAVATFNCSTKIESEQFVEILGEAGSIVLPRPFYNNADDGVQHVYVRCNGIEEILTVEDNNHYTAMADAFADSITSNTPVPTPLSDAINNMHVIDALFTSASERRWVTFTKK
jgi:predicted dehydrogenase